MGMMGLSGKCGCTKCSRFGGLLLFCTLTTFYTVTKKIVPPFPRILTVKNFISHSLSSSHPSLREEELR